RPVIIPLGIEVERSTPARRRPNGSELFSLLSVSRIDPKKNLESLLRAVAAVVSRNPRVILNIAGSGDPRYVAKLHSLSRALDIAGHVNWLGPVEGEKKAETFAAANAFVLPSHSENFGLAVVEALAAGLPCVVSRQVAVSSDIEASRAGIVVDTD